MTNSESMTCLGCDGSKWTFSAFHGGDGSKCTMCRGKGVVSVASHKASIAFEANRTAARRAVVLASLRDLYRAARGGESVRESVVALLVELNDGPEARKVESAFAKFGMRFA